MMTNFGQYEYVEKGNKFMINKLLMLFMVSTFFATNAISNDSIVFAIDPTKPSMQFISKTGEVVGFEIDFLNEMGRLGGFTPVLKKVKWQGIFDGLVNSEYDAACASVSITEKRKETLAFTIPYYNVSQAILVLKENKTKSLNDLKGKKIGAKKGTTSSKALGDLEGAEIVLFDDVPLAVQALSEKTVDAVICDGPVAGQYALVDKPCDLKLAIVLKAEKLELYGIAVKKGNKKLLNRLNRAIAAAQNNNKDIEFQKKWFSELLEKNSQ